MDSPGRSLWTVVLAGGEGRRLRALTRALHGEDVPKQFASLCEERSLLQATLDRTAMFCPQQRTVVVVARDHEALARRNLGDQYARVELMLQPRNLGTAVGLLLPLSEIAAREPEANVLVSPADHFVADVRPLLATIHRAIASATRLRAIVLVGAVAESAETEYGWIVPGAAREGGCSSVLRFVEKPTSASAEGLFRDRALWNTFLLSAPVATLLEGIGACLPEHAARFDACRRAIGTGRAAVALSEAYRDLAPADLSRDVLARLETLLVVPLEPCGWSDWGTPERVFKSLRGTPTLERLRKRLTHAGDRELLAKIA